MRFVTVTNTSRQTVFGDQIEVAESSLTRLFGLLGRHHLEPGRGLWIRPSSGVHTIGMAFAIDVAGLDKDLRIIKLWPNLAPFRMTSVSFRLHSVVELPAGRLAACASQLGDQLSIQ